jgi:anti-anti-sigma factor
MSIKKEEKNGRAILKIEGTMSIYDAASIHRALVAALADCETPALDLHGVKNCDAAGIQVIWAALKTVDEKGKGFSISGVSTHVLDAFKAAGLNPDDLLHSKGTHIDNETWAGNPQVSPGSSED